MTRAAAILILCCLLAGCAARGVLSIVPVSRGETVSLQRVYVASNRIPVQASEGGLFRQQFGESRDPRMHFARVDISIPASHAVGHIEWPGSSPPDPDLHFVARVERRYDGMPAFSADLLDTAPDEVVVFVHGYNVNNAEAIYRLAQIAHDFEAKIPVIAYSWPSAGNPRGYVYDRDSVIFSRDGLESLLVALTGQGRRVTLVAHSMGSQLVMEVLRQMAISGNTGALRGIEGVALISPDIDEDVFFQQARRIAPFPAPFVILVSNRDRILDLSAYLTGKPTRLGSIADATRLQGLPVQVIDLSDYGDGDAVGHSTAFTSPTAIALLRGLSVRNAPLAALDVAQR